MIFSSEEKAKIVSLKSVRILKWAVPILGIGLLFEYLLYAYRPSMGTYVTFFLIDLPSLIIVGPVIILPFLIFAAIFALAVDILLIFLERK